MAAPGSPVPADRSGEVFIIRRTRAQRRASVLGWALFATPLLALVPLLPADDRAIVVMVVIVSGLLLAGFDAIVRRHESIEVHVDGLASRGRLVPWWSIDDLRERRVLGVRTVELVVAGSPLRLALPRSGPFVRNPGFDADLALLRTALDAARVSDPIGPPPVGGRDDDVAASEARRVTP